MRKILAAAMAAAIGIGPLAPVLAQTSAPPAAPAPAKKTITHEALWMMKRVGAPVVSPDGKWALFNVNEPAYKTDEAVQDLWLVPTDGSAPPRRLTSTKAPESDPAWSPDGSKIAFVAKRDGDDQSQVYILDLAGGEAHRLTKSATGASNPQWRPDGGAILYEASVYPGAMDDEANKKAAQERKDRKFNVRVYEHSPIRYWNVWLDDTRPTLFVQSLEEGAKAVDILSPTALAKGEGFGGAGHGEGAYSLSPVWSPDGKEIVFTATAERWNGAFANVPFSLYRMPAGGGEPAVVTPLKGDFADLVFSPDGKTLLFNYSVQDTAVYNLPRVQKVAWPAGGAATPLTPGFDREAARFVVTPDNKTVYMLVPEASKENLYSVPFAGGKPTLVIEPKNGGYTALDMPRTGKPVLVAQYGSSVSPAEVVRIDPAKKTHANLTSIDTAAAAAIDWQPPQHFWFVGKAGRQIHNMIVLPPNFDPSKKYPLLMIIHGGPASTNADQISLRWNYHLLAAPGFVILLTDYTGSTSYGEGFAQAIKGDPLKGPGEELNQAVDEALKRYPFIDGARMCAGGASYGGHLTNWLEATTTRFKCLVSHAGEVDLRTQWGESDFNYQREVVNGGPPWDPNNRIWWDQSPISYGDQWKTPMLMSIGERDYRVPLGNTLEAWTVLQRQHVPSRLLVWPDAWHWILKPEDSRQFYKEVHAWTSHYLLGAPAVPEGPVQ